MELSYFDYNLPKESIALFPSKKRDEARLLNVNRESGDISHHVFHELIDILRPDDVLVLNNTRVIPARLFGQKRTGGKIEALLLNELNKDKWEVLLKPSGRVKEGSGISFGENGEELKATVEDSPRPDSGKRILQFDNDFEDKLKKLGHIPLPPYIDREDLPIDRELYQTVFAQKDGAVASPTAGLHFDQKLLDRLQEKGIQIVYVTLHVSYGTFQPISAENIKEHKMFEEEYEIPKETVEAIKCAKKEKRRVISCGTTCVRALESAVDDKGSLQAKRDKTSIFIYPSFSFKVIDGLITNFHLPKSTLIVMTAAFLGQEKLLKAYKEALDQNYHFASYGDAMVIL